MSTNVRLKFKDKNKPVKKDKVCEIAYGHLNIPFVRLFPTNDGFKAVCRNEKEADQILDKAACRLFEKEGITVVMPPDMKARRTVFVRKLDHHIGSHAAGELEREIQDQNKHLKVAEVTKIKDYTHVIKIRFEEIQMADQVLQRGFLAYNMSVTPDQIEKETFVNVLTCFICYRMGEHATKNCPEKEKTYCSECTSENHKWTECKSQIKACLNCKRDGKEDYKTHRTLAMACPHKKNFIRNKKEEEKKKIHDGQQKTFADIAKKAVDAANKNQVTTELKLSEVKHYQILISIMHAHVMNVCNPGTYSKELNQMLKQNNLKEMWFPENPDSSKLLYATGTNDLEKIQTETQKDEIPTEISSEEETTDEEEETISEVVPRDPRLRSQTNKKCETETFEFAAKSKKQELIPEMEVGLKIYVNEQTPYPTKEPSTEEIITGIKEGKYKFTYENSLYATDYVLSMIEYKAIEIQKRNFKRVDETYFRKIRNGLQEHSTSKQQRKNRKK